MPCEWLVQTRQRSCNCIVIVMGKSSGPQSHVSMGKGPLEEALSYLSVQVRKR